MLKSSALLTPLLCLAPLLMADTLVLKNGQALEGTLLSEDELAYKLEVVYGTMLVAKTKVLRVEKDTPELIAAREKKAEQAKQLATSMRAEGKVLWKGQWITEEQKKAEDAKLAEAKKKREAERKKAVELAAKKKKEEEEKLKLAQQQYQQQQQQLLAQSNPDEGGRRGRIGRRGPFANNDAYNNAGYAQNEPNRYNSGNRRDPNRTQTYQNVINNMRQSGYGDAINSLLRNNNAATEVLQNLD